MKFQNSPRRPMSRALISAAVLLFLLAVVGPSDLQVFAKGRGAAGNNKSGAGREAPRRRPGARRRAPARRAVQTTLALTARAVPTKSVQQLIDETVHQEAALYGIDPDLIFALMDQESGRRPGAVSHKGARGVMQLMPGTAKRWGVRDPHDPVQCIRGGTRYLVWLIDRFKGNVRLGLAGYNAGEGAVDKYNWRIPPYRETQDYVRKIEQRYLARKAGKGSKVRTTVVSPTAAVAVAQTPSPTTENKSTYTYRFRVSTTNEGNAVLSPYASR